MSTYQTFLPNCDCKGKGVLFKDNVLCCRECRIPYGQGGKMNYEDVHFLGNLSNQAIFPTIKKVCPNKINGSCPLHNLHCSYPDCEQ